MNARISLSAIATYLRAALDTAGIEAHVSTAYALDYLTAMGTTAPAVWILAQRLTPKDDGRGFSERARQHCKVEIAMRVVVQRYAAGATDGEENLNELVDALVTEMFGYKPTGADRGFAFVFGQDGPPSESVMTVDLMFTTDVSHQRSSA